MPSGRLPQPKREVGPESRVWRMIVGESAIISGRGMSGIGISGRGISGGFFLFTGLAVILEAFFALQWFWSCSGFGGFFCLAMVLVLQCFGSCNDFGGVFCLAVVLVLQCFGLVVVLKAFFALQWFCPLVGLRLDSLCSCIGDKSGAIL